MKWVFIRNAWLLAFSIAILCIMPVRPLQARLLATSLRCGFISNPQGVDENNPRLNWQLQSVTPRERNQLQTAFQILVASSAKALAANQGDIWDSGKVVSDSTSVSYCGRALLFEQQIFWKVRVWDGDDHPSDWSSAATWTMGLLKPADWQGKWISASTNCACLPVFRREFTVEPGLRRAVMSICGLGYYELSANGSKVGDSLLAPGWSKYDKTCLYDTLDLTSQLTNGVNTFGVMLGSGMYDVPASARYTKFTGTFGVPKFIAQLHLFYTNGTSRVIFTDTNWLFAPGPITFSSVYGGEDFDARLSQAGWDRPGFDASTWPAALLSESPGGVLRGTSRAAPPIKATEMLKPVATNVISSGEWVMDLGQNASLIPRLTVQGRKGAMVRITPAELIHPDGTIDRSSVGGGACYWQYTLAGNGKETWLPRFFYHGCRFLQVEFFTAPGSTELPILDDLQGVVIQNSSMPVGEFSCSNDLFNRIHSIVRWAQRNNLASVITDCPHRERLGWLEQYHLHGPSLRYEFDLSQLYSKTMDDMADSQLPSGLVPDIAPEYPVFSGGFRDSPEWGSSAVIVPWQQYQFTGDDTLLRRYYSTMSNYVAYLQTQAIGYILYRGLGDWYDLGPNPPGYAQLTPVSLTATAYFYQDAQILAQTAVLLGKAGDAERFSRLAGRVRAAFNNKFYLPVKGCYSTGSQTAQSLPLALGLVDESHRSSVTATLVANVLSRGLTAGDIGHVYLLRALADAGRSDVIFNLHSQTNRPGYGYILGTGATALTEGWDGSNSQDHFMLGHIMEWFYADLAGIAPDPAAPGFKNIIIRPQPVGNVTWAKAAYDSVHGRVVCEWKKADDKFSLHIEIPVNSTATVFVPSGNPDRIFESGELAAGAPGVHFVRKENERSIYQVTSGVYDFVTD